MFEYIKDRISFTSRLGSHISHKIVAPFDLGRDAEHKTIDKLNKLDRFQLAKNFLDNGNSRFESERYIPRKKLIEDIACRIDYSISKSYLKQRLHLYDLAPSKVKIDTKPYGFIYHFKENENKD